MRRHLSEDLSSNSLLENQTKKLSNLALLDSMMKFFAPGSCYYFIINDTFDQIQYVSQKVGSTLGIVSDNFKDQGLKNFLHPEDLKSFDEKSCMINDFFTRRIQGGDYTDFQASTFIRLKNNDSNYRTILHQVKPFILNKYETRISYYLGVHFDMTHLRATWNESVTFSDCNKELIKICASAKRNLRLEGMADKFTQKEMEIILQLTRYPQPEVLSAKLHISTNTLSSHMKNILRKSGSKNSAELLARCLKERLI